MSHSYRPITSDQNYCKLLIWMPFGESQVLNKFMISRLLVSVKYRFTLGNGSLFTLFCGSKVMTPSILSHLKWKRQADCSLLEVPLEV